MFVWPTSHMGMMHPRGDQRSRSMAEDFMTYAEASEAGVSYNEAKSLLSVSTNQAETRKSFYEELSLLYVPYGSNTILLTPLGKQLFDLLYGQDFSNLSDDIARQATALIVWAMTQTQINRPQSRGVPRLSTDQWTSCDVRPYAAAWSAMMELDNKLFLHEFMGPLRRLHSVAEFQKVIDEIRLGRMKGRNLANQDEMSGKSEMNYRIYWKSHLSVAEQVLSWDDSDKAFEFQKQNFDLVSAAIRFQRGCSGNVLQAFQAKPWSNPEDYFMYLTGAACPPFLASGTPSIKVVDGQALADLSACDITKGSTTHFVLTGGADLCNLQLKMPCFHPSSPDRLLRIDAKEQLSQGSIVITLGLGRPIVNLPVLKQKLDDSDD